VNKIKFHVTFSLVLKLSHREGLALIHSKEFLGLTGKRKNVEENTPKNTPPGPTSLEIFQHAPQNLVDFYSWIRGRYGDVVSFSPANQTATFVFFHPQHIQRILQDNARAYTRSPAWEKVERVLGKGLLITDGEVWLRQRRLLQPFFQRQALKDFVGYIVEKTKALISRWEFLTKENKPIEVFSEMMELSLSIILKLLMGIDLENYPFLSVCFKKAYEQMNRLLGDPNYSPDTPTIPENQEYQKAVSTLEQLISQVVQEHEKGTKNFTLLSRFLNSRYEDTGKPMTDLELRDQLMTFLIAGYITTGNALAWSWYLLSQHPQDEQKLHHEVLQVLGDRDSAFEDLAHLSYAHMVFLEAMRLYPPVWLQGRMCAEEDVLAGYTVPPKAIIEFPPYHIHRDSRFWKEPEKFFPERFSPDQFKKRPRYAYFPFGGGAHLCIGSHLAMMEGEIVLSMIARRYRMRLVPGQKIELLPLITILPRNGLWMILEPWQ
jgi:cytochrome P450